VRSLLRRAKRKSKRCKIRTCAHIRGIELESIAFDRSANRSIAFHLLTLSLSSCSVCFACVGDDLKRLKQKSVFISERCLATSNPSLPFFIIQSARHPFIPHSTLSLNTPIPAIDHVESKARCWHEEVSPMSDLRPRKRLLRGNVQRMSSHLQSRVHMELQIDGGV
jgi:hypothetical protein